MAKIADGGCDLKLSIGCGGCGNENQGGWRRLGQVDLEARLTATARGADGSELNELAVVTANYLSLLYGSHHGCHKLCVAGGPRARTAAHVR